MFPVSGRCSTRSSPRQVRRTCADSSGTTSAASATTRHSRSTCLAAARRPRLGWIDRIEVSPDGSRALAVTEGRVIGWTLPGGKAVTLAGSPDRYVLDARFSPDGKRLASLVLDGGGKPIPASGPVSDSPASLEVWDAQADKRLRSTELQTAGHGNLAFRPGGRQVAVRVQPWGNDDRSDTDQYWVSVVDVETGQVVRTIEGKGKPINDALTYSPDGSLLRRADGLAQAKRLGRGDREARADDRHEGRSSFAMPRSAPTGCGWPWLATADRRRSGRYPVGSPCSRYGSASSTQCAVDTAATANPWRRWGSNWIKIWDGGTGEYRFLIRGARRELTFTPDGARIAAAGDAGTVRFWDARQEQGASRPYRKGEPLRRFFQP